jgi:hypothetical protein
MEITFHIFNNAPYCEMEAIFVVKGVLHWGTPQVERCYPRFTHPLQRGVGVIWGAVTPFFVCAAVPIILRPLNIKISHF